MFISEKLETQDGNADSDRWLPYVNEEYENVGTDEQLSSVSLLLANEDLPNGYNRIPDASSLERKSFWKSFRKAVSTSISMAFSLFPSTVFAILYVDVNTAILC